jgi:hypothetical protein
MGGGGEGVGGLFCNRGGDGAADLKVEFFLNDSCESLVPLLLNHRHSILQISNLLRCVMREDHQLNSWQRAAGTVCGSCSSALLQLRAGVQQRPLGGLQNTSECKTGLRLRDCPNQLRLLGFIKSTAGVFTVTLVLPALGLLCQEGFLKLLHFIC